MLLLLLLLKQYDNRTTHTCIGIDARASETPSPSSIIKTQNPIRTMAINPNNQYEVYIYIYLIYYY